MIATLGRYGDLRARSVTDVLLPSALEFGSRRETLSGILAALAGGYTAGRLAGAPKESTAGWRGLTTWALTTLVIYEVCGISLGKVRARDQRVRFKARLFHSVVLPSGVFSRARGHRNLARAESPQ